MGAYPTSPHKYVLTAIDIFVETFLCCTVNKSKRINRSLSIGFYCVQLRLYPKKIMSELGTQLVSELFHDLTKLLEITISQDSLKHPHTTGVNKRSHAALNRILNLTATEPSRTSIDLYHWLYLSPTHHTILHMLDLQQFYCREKSE